MQRKPFCEDCKGFTGGTKKEGDPRRASVRTSWKLLEKKILITQTLGGREEIWSRKTETIGEEETQNTRQVSKESKDINTLLDQNMNNRLGVHSLSPYFFIHKYHNGP